MNPYQQQVKLLIKVLSLLDSEPCFALKGGTAINLFVEHLPRLSVDIDLVYLPDDLRNEALAKIKAALDRLAQGIKRMLPASTVTKSYEDKNDALRLVITDGATIKVELSPVLRGTVFPPEQRVVVPDVEDQFGFAEVNVVSLPDLYAGKMCAALDRQHPRDLFDVMLFFKNHQWTDDLRKALLVYIISHQRPISELIRPRLKNIDVLYAKEFKGMAFIDTEIASLEAAREHLTNILNQSMTLKERQFLMSFQNSQADWALLGLENIEQLPAIKWKQQNIKMMSEEKLKIELLQLAEILGI